MGASSLPYAAPVSIAGPTARRVGPGGKTSVFISTLTPQQRVVLGLLVNGRVNKQIAYDLGVSMTTVKAHVSAVLQKLNVYNRTQAVILANRVGFTS